MPVGRRQHGWAAQRDAPVLGDDTGCRLGVLSVDDDHLADALPRRLVVNSRPNRVIWGHSYGASALKLANSVHRVPGPAASLTAGAVPAAA